MIPKIDLLAEVLTEANKSAARLSQFVWGQVADSESKIRAFYRELKKKPVTFFFNLVFAPIIVAWTLYCGLKDIRSISIFQKIKLMILGFGFMIAGIGAWAIGTWFGSLTFAIFIWKLFGAIPAIGWFLGSASFLLITAFTQILMMNLICYIFLGLSKRWIIEEIAAEHSLSPESFIALDIAKDKEPNQTPQPITHGVMPPAAQESRHRE